MKVARVAFGILKFIIVWKPTVTHGFSAVGQGVWDSLALVFALICLVGAIGSSYAIYKIDAIGLVQIVWQKGLNTNVVDLFWLTVSFLMAFLVLTFLIFCSRSIQNWWYHFHK